MEDIKRRMIEHHKSKLECKLPEYLDGAQSLSGIGCRTSAAEAFYHSPASVLDKAKRIGYGILHPIKYMFK